ncbi:MAG: glycoside hydrolase family 20 zincin-like fold domain-containing protein [Bacteroidales bacterium]|nr:glycoside hydrolase family 20 zincin-like fold domain-containing protein [Bacteroidales bacterium]
MKNLRLLLMVVCAVLLLCACGKKSNPIVIIPQPVECQPKSGHFTINDETFLCFDNISPEDVALMKYINHSYKKYFSLTPNLGDKSSCHKNYILFSINKKENKEIGDEGYTLSVKKNKVIAKANTPAG